ncbi:clustered mitochondria protein [Pyrus ussuriensis x Pyrus communis]|uniref:Clustered mitochondria protein n=1 Tax=Pyrus ussuriensis x Pyrus communis TaxID=2448454 RepID=A0A5N5FTU2_9ROSA|nr:clustered mitochondria protein [Pyrus ussuriensis x Pyrus communis]
MQTLEHEDLSASCVFIKGVLEESLAKLEKEELDFDNFQEKKNQMEAIPSCNLKTQSLMQMVLLRKLKITYTLLWNQSFRLVPKKMSLC